MKTTTHIRNILVIIIIAGAFGGIGNYLLLPEVGKHFTLQRSIILGIIAAGVLPLFLKLISSSLLDTDGSSIPYKNYIVLISFSLLTGVFADLFLQGMYRKVFYEFEEQIETQKKELFVANEKSKILLNGIQYQSVKENVTLNNQQKMAAIKMYNLNPNVIHKQQIEFLKRSYKLTTAEATFFKKVKEKSIIILNQNTISSSERNSIKKLEQKNLIDSKSFNDELWVSEKGIINK